MVGPNRDAAQVLVRTRTQNYTAGDAPRLLEDLGLDQQVRGRTLAFHHMGNWQ